MLDFSLGHIFSAKWTFLQLEMRWASESVWPAPVNATPPDDWFALKGSERESNRQKRKMKLEASAPDLCFGIDLDLSGRWLGVSKRSWFRCWLFAVVY